MSRLATSFENGRGFLSRELLVGSFCALFAAAIFPVCLVTAAMIPDCSPVTILFLQSYWTYAFSLCPIVYGKENKIEVEEKLGILLRALALTVASTTSYWAIIYIPAGDVYALRFGNAVFVSLAGSIFLKETFTKLQWVSVLGVVTGVLLITKPSFIFHSQTDAKENSWIGVLLSLVSCAFQTVESLLLRLTPRTQTTIKVCSSRLVLAIGALFLMGASGDLRMPECGQNLVPLLAGLVCIVPASGLFDYASRFLKAGYFSLIRSSSVLFTYIYQVVLLNTTPNWASTVGATLICTFVILSTVSERRDHCSRRRLADPPTANEKRELRLREIENLPSTAV